MLERVGFEQSQEDECLFIRRSDDGDDFILFHVDDLLIVTPSVGKALQLEEELSKEFEITVMGQVKSFLGMRVFRSRDGHFALSQSAYVDRLLREFGLQDAKSSKIPLDQGYLDEEEVSQPMPTNDQ